MSTPETVLVAPVAAVQPRPVYHLPDENGHPRCVTDDAERYRPVERDSIDDRFRCCRSCDPEVHVQSGDGALCDVLAEMDPDDLEPAVRGD